MLGLFFLTSTKAEFVGRARQQGSGGGRRREGGGKRVGERGGETLGMGDTSKTLQLKFLTDANFCPPGEHPVVHLLWI